VKSVYYKVAELRRALPFEWVKLRVLLIAERKEDPKECPFATLPHELLVFIVEEFILRHMTFKTLSDDEKMLPLEIAL